MSMTTTDDDQTSTGLNPFSGSAVAEARGGAAAETESQRAIAEVKAALISAKQFPRDQLAATERILASCCRPTLAESAVYSYTRGGAEVTGPSIRLAEAIAQAWGNLQFGIRELSQSGGKSTVEAFCWDVETNTRQVKVFEVPHIRHTRNGAKLLTDPRDVYELVANQGARRLRACILGVVPGDVVDAALTQCEATLRTKVDVTPEGIKALLGAFAEIGVSGDQVAQKLGHRADSIVPAEVVRLRKIYRGIKDGYSTVEAEFPRADGDAPVRSAAATAAASAAAAKAGRKPSAPKPAAMREEDRGDAFEPDVAATEGGIN